MSSCLVCTCETNQKIASVSSYDILKCPVCDLRFLSPLPSEQVLHDFYNSEANVNYYGSVAERKLKTGVGKIKPLMKLCQGRDFIDIGCSTGANVEAARRLGFKASGIDLCVDSIKYAKTQFPENQYSVSTIADIEAQQKSFDLLFCTEIIEHIPDPNSFMRSLIAIMKPGAILYLTTPDAGHFRVPRDFSKWKHVHAPDHLSYYCRKSLQTLLAEHKLEILKFKWTTQTTIRLIARRS